MDTKKILESLANTMSDKINYVIASDKLTFDGFLNQIKDTSYLLQGDGMYSVTNGRIATFITKIHSYKFPNLPNVITDGFILKTPKVPEKFYKQIVKLFKDVNKAQKTEIAAMLFYKNNNFEWFIPEQTVTGVSVLITDKGKEEIAKFYSEGYLPIIEIHSHHTMSANFSSIDDRDKKTLEPFDMVIGNIENNEPTSTIRYFHENEFHIINMSDLFDIKQVELSNELKIWKSKLVAPAIIHTVPKTYVDNSYDYYKKSTNYWNRHSSAYDDWSQEQYPYDSKSEKKSKNTYKSLHELTDKEYEEYDKIGSKYL